MGFNTDLAKIKSLFFQDSLILIKESLEGSQVNDQNQLVLGCQAGPAKDVDNLLHEMGHFIEINDQRILRTGWGLAYPEIEVCGQICREPRTTQAIERELRVFAIQKHLIEMVGLLVEPNYEKNKAQIIKWMNDFVLIPEPDRFGWCEKKINEYYQGYTKDQLMNEWNRKKNLLKS